MNIRKSILIASTVAVVGAGSLAIVPTALAHGNNQPSITQREEYFENHLNQAVKDGKLTEEQKNKIIEKHKQNIEWRKSLKDMTPEQRREAIKQHREEMKKWAEENGIPKPPRGFHKHPGGHQK